MSLRASIVDYCATIGKDPGLVQGAGGNVSFKEGNILWVKASGTWLSDALAKDIFIPVELSHLQDAMAAGDFDVSPKLCEVSLFKPSIETLLHALMPHPVVVHLHAIEVLAHLVRQEYEADLKSRLESTLDYVVVSYHKPGASLAKAVSVALDQMPDASIILLQNHGIVIGGADVAIVDRNLRTLIEVLKTSPREPITKTSPIFPLEANGGQQYFPISDHAVHQLALDKVLFERLQFDWALYPDHVVFLGPYAHKYSSLGMARVELSQSATLPELIFVGGVGVFTLPEFNLGKLVQIRCYYDVLSRLPQDCEVVALNIEQIAELLNWDAEQYRMGFAK